MATKVSASYYAQIQGILARSAVYPEKAKANGDQGECQVRITFDRAGTISSKELVRRSGTASLDQACIDAVNRAGRFPPVSASEEPGVAYFSVILPINWKLEEE